MKRRNRRLSLKWEIFSYIIVFVLILLLFLWVFQTIFLEGFYESIVEKQMKFCAETAINADHDDIERDLMRHEMSVIVYDESGTVLYSNSYYRNSYLNNIPPHVLGFLRKTTAESDGEKFTVISEGSENMDFAEDMPRRILYSMISEKKLVLVEAVISPIGGTLETLRVQLGWASVLFLILSLVFAAVISRNISRPLVKLNTSAKRLAARDFNVDFTVKGSREVSELAETLEEAATELSRVEELRKELIGNVSHDLRTPLTMITACAEMMRDLPGEHTPENLQTIIDEANRLSALVDDLLNLSRLQGGAHGLSRSRFNLTRCIYLLMERYRKLIDQEDYCIDFVSTREIYVNADESKISQVIYNLINNAINFTGENKLVMIRQIDLGEKVRIEIEDTGNGIPQDQIKYIWDRYYRASNTDHCREKTGSGIGLSIVKEVMELHREKYGVISEEGKGSIFWFELSQDMK